MSGELENAQVKGQEAAYYRKKPSGDAQAWPPRFMKVVNPFIHNLSLSNSI